jgi:hypothetical protein
MKDVTHLMKDILEQCDCGASIRVFDDNDGITLYECTKCEWRHLWKDE